MDSVINIMLGQEFPVFSTRWDDRPSDKYDDKDETVG